MTTISQPSIPHPSPAPQPLRYHVPTPGDNNNDPEDVLSDSLQTLYEYQPITLTSAGVLYTYTHSTAHSPPVTITLQTPDTEAENWSLHASSVWVASIQLARGLSSLRLDDRLKRKDHTSKKLRVLELGAGAGLPSILIAKLYPNVSVLATDYPDTQVICTLSENIKRNGVETNCCARPYAWGIDPAVLLSATAMNEPGGKFDVIIAADTLWNPDLHVIFIESLQDALYKGAEARIYLVAGLHTGRYTIDSFLRAVARAGFRVVEVLEKEVVDAGGTSGRVRQWDVSRAEYEEEKDRRRWTIWIELYWEESQLSK